MSSATSSAQRFMSTEPSRKSGRVRDAIRVTSACFSQSHTGPVVDQAQTPWVALLLRLGLILGVTTVASGQPSAPPWATSRASRDGFPREVLSTVERVWRAPTLQRTVHGRSARLRFAV